MKTSRTESFEQREHQRRLDAERGRAYRSMLDAGHVFADGASAPEWACLLSVYQHCGAAHFERLDWARIWQKAVEGGDWPGAFLSVVALEDQHAAEILGQKGSAYETGKRVARWIEASTSPPKGADAD